MKLPSTKEFNDFVRGMYVWDKDRILNYAYKKGLTFHQAIYELARKPKAGRDAVIDAVVDPEFHSSNRPKLETV